MKPSPEYSHDASSPGGSDASEAARLDGSARRCSWCRAYLEVTARSDAQYCSQSCRQAAWRFRRDIRQRRRTETPMRLAYADPPYPGLAKRYYQNHADYGGEVDHGALLSQLADYDGWALSTSARAVPQVLALCVASGMDVRVAAWVRGARQVRSSWPLSSWEPVVFAGGRRLPSVRPGHDSLVAGSRPRLTDPDRVVGAKPAAFIDWLFDLLGAQSGDEMVDLFPGSGGVARAWDLAQ